MPLDEFLPEFETWERHAITIMADPKNVHQALLTVDFNRSRIIKLLFSLRGLQRFTKNRGARTIRLPDFIQNGFILLADQPGRELILGLIGRFWTLRGGLVRVAADEFAAYPAAGQAKAVWGFEFQTEAPQQTRLVTETRVHIADPVSRRRFGLYWRLIGPFSGLIRQELLRLIKEQAENKGPDSLIK